MSQGFLLFGFDNEEISYGQMAVWSARRINKWLSKPVSLVTNSFTKDNLDKSLPGWQDSFDQIILSESVSTHTKRYVNRQLTFHNLNRVDAWDLTPYDETIVIDTDVLIQSSMLNKLWSCNEDYIVCENSKDIFGRRDIEFEYLHDYSVKFYWATVFYFKKNNVSKIFFDYCKHIKENYNWNKYAHDLSAGPVRNDFIWSIALHNLGYINTIPWNIPYSVPKDKIIKLDDSSVVILGDTILTKVSCDIHIMNKFDLMEEIKKELGI
jgi:hypothetical protein